MILESLAPQKLGFSLYGRSKSSIYNSIQEGSFPRQIKMGDGEKAAISFIEAEIQEWINQRVIKSRQSLEKRVG